MDMEPEVDGMKVNSRDDERMRDTGAAEQGQLSDFHELVTAWVTNGQTSKTRGGAERRDCGRSLNSLASVTGS